MKVLRITNGFEKMTDAELLVRTSFIISSMTGNPDFTTPSPTLTEMTASFNSFQGALQQSETGDRQEVAEKNAIREILINQLHLLSNYVLFTAANDEVKASSTGFRASKTPAPQPPMSTPEGLQLKNGVNKGELKFSFKKVQGARSYRFEITPSPVTPTSVWEASANTITKKQYAGLESGKEYNCRVAAYGIKEQVVYSDIVSRVAL